MRALALVLFAACAPAAPATIPACPEDEDAAEPPGEDLEPRVEETSIPEALAAAGHRCAASKDDQGVTVCEPDAPGLVPFVVVQSPPLVLFAAYFKHREEVTCPELAPLLNDLNAKADGIKVVCEKERVSFTTSFVLPSRGFMPSEVADQARRFQGLIQLVLRDDAFRSKLE